MSNWTDTLKQQRALRMAQFRRSMGRMDNKRKVATLVAVVLGLVISVAAFAGGFSVVTYDDVSSTYRPAVAEVRQEQYIFNGDFSQWTNGYPDGWNVPTPVLSPGWEVHFANMDLARNGGSEGGTNPAVGYFFRTGSSGSQFANISQRVSPKLTTGGYWVQVHMTAWEHNVESAYNSVAWYGFGESENPASVKEWRELFPDEFVCANGDGRCNYLGRKETVLIKAGSFLHVQMGMKFPDFNSWTVFGLDDISITGFGDEIKVDVTDYTDEGDIRWDSRAER